MGGGEGGKGRESGREGGGEGRGGEARRGEGRRGEGRGGEGRGGQPDARECYSCSHHSIIFPTYRKP